MLTITQIIGIIIAILLTSLFLVIGYQITLILKELKNSIHKINKIIDHAEKITETIAEPIISFSGFVTGLKDGLNLIQTLTNKKADKKYSHD